MLDSNQLLQASTLLAYFVPLPTLSVPLP